ncbi:hypothetical protein MFRU_053g00110 [Monilinia fructicola]|nr:hypothetical protein MFRU_053g00110 [Monilinia fructicola]
MMVIEFTHMVNNCCPQCCKEEQYGDHDYCGWCEVTDCL